MTDFTKTKMHFALALLGTLFALHPFLDRIGDKGFVYNYWYGSATLKVFYVYGLLAGLLALTVYCYAVALVSERPSSWMERVGNYAYGLVIIVLPLYAGLYLASTLADELEETGWAWALRVAPVLPLILGILWFLASQVFALRLRKRLSDQDRTAKIGHLAEQEIVSLRRAQELFNDHHYDLSVIEAWKAIEARLRRVLLLRRIAGADEHPQTLLKVATRTGLVREPALGLIHELRRQRNVAISTEPLTREAADKSLKAARDILPVIPIDDPHHADRHAA
jgi:hypothetical protein